MQSAATDADKVEEKGVITLGVVLGYVIILVPLRALQQYYHIICSI